VHSSDTEQAKQEAEGVCGCACVRFKVKFFT